MRCVRDARCHNCGVKGNNTYQIVYTGNSDVAMDGAGVRLSDVSTIGTDLKL